MFVLTTICLSLFLFRRYLVIILLRNYGKFSKFMNFRHKHFIYSDWSILSKPLHISYELCVLSGFMYPFFCSFELAAGIRLEMSITYSILFYYFNYYLQTLQTCLQPELNNNTATELSPFQYNFDRQVLSSYPTNVSISFLDPFKCDNCHGDLTLLLHINLPHPEAAPTHDIPVQLHSK